ncbi:hypothetical protein D3C86_1597610 [compost metagenome]
MDRFIQGLPHLIQIDYGCVIKLRLEPRRRRWRGGRLFQRPAFGPPFRQTPVQHLNMRRTHRAQHPPHPWRGANPHGVVHHDVVGLGQPQGAHTGGEGRCARHHVGKAGVLIGADLKVEEDGAGQAARFEIGPSVPPVQMPTAIDDAEVRIAKAGG